MKVKLDLSSDIYAEGFGEEVFEGVKELKPYEDEFMVVFKDDRPKKMIDRDTVKLIIAECDHVWETVEIVELDHVRQKCKRCDEERFINSEG